MTSHQLARMLLQMKDCNIEVNNAAGDMGAEIEAIRVVDDRFGSRIQLDSDCIDDELPEGFLENDQK